MARAKNRERVKNFRISLIDDASHREIKSLRFTRNTFLVTLITVIVVLLAAVWALIAFTPLRTSIPGYPDAHARRMAVQNALRIDSLESIVSRWELYAENLSRVVSGEDPVRIDSLVLGLSQASLAEVDRLALARRDSLLRQTVREEEQFDLSGGRHDLSIEGMHFFPPLKGVISQGYDSVLHPYIDITAPANSVVMSVLDGTVIFAGWNDEAGYTIQIQHAGGLVSIYKHNQKLLKKTGDKVSAGSSIAIVGNTGTLTTGDHLHFELWYQGEAVDPTKYITF